MRPNDWSDYASLRITHQPKILGRKRFIDVWSTDPSKMFLDLWKI